MNPFLGQLADAGVPSLLLGLAVGFWAQFQNALGLIGDAVSWPVAKMRVFASRTIVIVTRKIWWVILPVMLVATVAGSISAFIGSGNLWWWALLNLMGKLLAFGAAIMMAWMAASVRHVDQNDGRLNAATQQGVNAWYGRPWLFVPMVMVALFCLVAFTGLTFSDTALVADRVHLFHSFVNAVVSVLMFAFTLSFVLAVGATLYAFASVGIDLGGGAWNTFAVPLITVLMPIITSTNNAKVEVSAEARKSLKQSVAAVLTDNKFVSGAAAAWVLWFLSFHSALALLIQCVVLIALVAILLSYVWVTGKKALLMAEINTVIILTAGAVMLAWRIIEAASSGDRPVVFYEHFGNVVGNVVLFFSDIYGAIAILVFGFVIALAGNGLRKSVAEGMGKVMLCVGLALALFAIGSLCIQAARSMHGTPEPTSFASDTRPDPRLYLVPGYGPIPADVGTVSPTRNVYSH